MVEVASQCLQMDGTSFLQAVTFDHKLSRAQICPKQSTAVSKYRYWHGRIGFIRLVAKRKRDRIRRAETSPLRINSSRVLAMDMVLHYVSESAHGFD